MEKSQILEKICEHNEVKDAQLKIQNGKLTAFIVPMNYCDDKDEELQQSIKRFLASSIPYSQLPSNFIFCNEFQVGQEANTQTEEDLSFNEDKVIQTLNYIWCQSLEIRSADTENTFVALGGNSIKAMALIVEVEKQFGIDISFQEFFKFSNLTEFRNFVIKKLSYD